MHNLSDVVRQFKQEWTSQLDDQTIAEVCREEGMIWRQTVLTPIVTIKVFFLQILHGNTACEGLAIWREWLLRARPTAKPGCGFRCRYFKGCWKGRRLRMQDAISDRGRWLGHRLFYVDGSSFSMPDKPGLQKEFGQPPAQKAGCGFPVAHFLALMHAGTGMVLKVLTAPMRTHDLSGTIELHPDLRG